MTQEQKFGVVLLAMGIWIATVPSLPDISDTLSILMWAFGGAILVLGALTLANCD